MILLLQEPADTAADSEDIALADSVVKDSQSELSREFEEQIGLLDDRTPIRNSSSDSSPGDLLTNYNNQNITYDGIGNPLSYRDGITFTWSSGRQLQTYSKGNTSISYTYDNDGMRLSKNVDGVEYTYLYNGGLLMRETVGEKILDFYYDANGQAIGFKYRSSIESNGSTYYYAYNYRGDIVGFYDYTGAVYCTYTYDPWGKVTSVKNSSGQNVVTPTLLANIQPLRYRGYVYDNETGLYYLQSRYYDPVARRFINADGLVSTGTGVLSFNMYLYCNNNPINLYDSSGNRPGVSRRNCNSDFEYQSRLQTIRDIGSGLPNNKQVVSQSYDQGFSDIINGTIKFLGAVAGSITVNVGFGAGGYFSTKAGPVEISGGVRHTMLSMVINKNGIDFGVEAKAGAEFAFLKKFIDVSFISGYYHSHFCNRFAQEEKHSIENCPNAKHYNPGEPTFTVGIGNDYYIIVGFNWSVEWDEDIYNELMNGE